MMRERETSHATEPVQLPRRYPPAPLVGVAAAVFNDTGAVLLVQRGRPPRGSVGSARWPPRLRRTAD